MKWIPREGIRLIPTDSDSLFEVEDFDCDDYWCD